MRTRSIHKLVTVGGVWALLRSNAGFLIANTLAGSCFGFLFWLLAARLYTPAEVGVGAAAISAVTFLASVGEMGLGTAVIRFAPGLGDARLRFINSALVAALLSTFAVSAVFILGIPLWSPELAAVRATGAHTALFVATTVAFGLAQLLDRVFVAFQVTHFLFARNLVANLLRLAVVVVAGGTLGATGLLLAIGVAALITLALSAIVFAPRALPGYRPRPAMAWSLLRDKAGYTLGNHLALLLWNAPPLLYPLLIVGLLGAEENARFYISWMIANLLFIVPTSVATAAFAQAAQSEGRGDSRFWRTMWRTTAGLIPVAAMLTLPAQLVLGAFGENYAVSSGQLFLLLICSVFPYTINTFVITYHRIHQRTSLVIWLSASTTAFCLAFSAGLGPWAGLWGVALGWLSGQTLGALVALLSKEHASGRLHPELTSDGTP